MRKIKFISLLLAGTLALCNNIMEGSNVTEEKVTVSFHDMKIYGEKGLLKGIREVWKKEIKKSELNINYLKDMVERETKTCRKQQHLFLNFKGKKNDAPLKEGDEIKAINGKISIGYYESNQFYPTFFLYMNRQNYIMKTELWMKERMKVFLVGEYFSPTKRSNEEITREFTNYLIERLSDSSEISLEVDSPTVIPNDSHDGATFAADNDSHESNSHNETMNLTDGKKYIIPWILVAFLTIVSGGLLIDKFFLRSEKKATNNKARKRGGRRNKK